MPLIPRGKRILVRPEVKPRNITTAAGIEIPVNDPYDKGKIVAVSKDIESDLKEGMYVAYERGAGVEVDNDGIKVLSMDERHIAFIIE